MALRSSVLSTVHPGWKWWSWRGSNPLPPRCNRGAPLNVHPLIPIALQGMPGFSKTSAVIPACAPLSAYPGVPGTPVSTGDRFWSTCLPLRCVPKPAYPNRQCNLCSTSRWIGFEARIRKPKPLCSFHVGGAGGDRTLYLFNAIEALSQVSYSPITTNIAKGAFSLQAPRPLWFAGTVPSGDGISPRGGCGPTRRASRSTGPCWSRPTRRGRSGAVPNPTG